MIPLRLSLRNFLCYRDGLPPLELEGVHLACLSGNNGHGKSALLDALTWALWGQGRAKSNDELVHLGRSEMEVQLDFRLGPDRFRVIRKYSRGRSARGGAGHTILELQQVRNGGFISLTANSVRETQAKIEALIHLDYDTFINSAFLLQGRADEFTLKTPAQRKEVLAQILGLSRYDALAEMARGVARQASARAQTLALDLARLDAELAQEPEYEVERRRIQTQLEDAERRRQAQEEVVAQLSERWQGLRRLAEELAQLQARLGEMRGQLAKLEAQANASQAKIASYQRLLAEAEAIATGYRRFQEARQLQSSLEEKLSAYLGLRDEARALEQTVDRARGELEAERRALAQAMETRQEMVRRRPALEKEMADIHRRRGDAERRKEAMERQREELTSILGQKEALQSQNRQLEAEVKGLRDRMALLSEGANEHCPLCGVEMGEVGRQHLEAAYRQEVEAKARAHRANWETLRKQSRQEESLRGGIAREESHLAQEGRTLPARRALLERELGQIDEAASALVGEQARLAGIEEALRMEDFAPRERARLVALSQEVTRLGYHPQAHEAARQEAAQWSEYEERYRRLDEARRLLHQEEEALSRAQGQALGWRGLLEADGERTRLLEDEVAALPTMERRLEMARIALEELRRRQAEGQRSLGAVLQKLESCRQMTVERKRQEERRGQAIVEMELHEELAEAFGKRGIQALLIERALPELEVEANALLGRMTGHRMHLKLETQRETRKGELAETLDIKIHDELGLRRYELYSGGEAFRANFALRVALSKLLARRAGAPLPILILDEGFGTQDTQGRERLVEAIGAIADDFELILVITHIDELKEAFPVRIEVTKGEEGATFSVS